MVNIHTSKKATTPNITETPFQTQLQMHDEVHPERKGLLGS